MLLVIPPLHRRWNGGILDSPPMSVRPSVRPSVSRQGFWNFKKTIGSIHSIPGIYHYGVSLLTPIHFRVPSLIFGPLMAKYLAAKWGFRNFLKKLLAQLISYLAFILMGWVSWPPHIFVFLASFSVPRWPNIWPKMGFPEPKKHYWLNSFHTWLLSLWGESLGIYTFSRS